MRRGDIWLARGERRYAAKTRPVVVLSVETTAFDSTVTCLLTSVSSDEIETRVRVTPTPENGLEKTSWVMTEKIVTLSREDFIQRIGRMSDEKMAEITGKVARVLGIT